MSISLVKGQKIDLTKGRSGLTKVVIGLGWDPVEARGFFGMKKKQANIDCDASVLMLNEQSKLTNEHHVICFYNKQSPCQSVIHSGDNLTGEGDGDDEQIMIDLSKVPANVDKILAVVNIYDCVNRKQDFGMIKSAYIRVMDGSSNEMVRFNLTESYAGKTALICGELYRHNGEWKFAAIGEGTHATHVNQIAAAHQ
ncbi:stress protein [Paenibacillus curdlanolyticus YK9]|uniref:Stress protein n=1 Tax=Paenibacillus curdlanolyticus YK9 TaxID=717606 RepID=E0IAK7_9BACL|nr:TerD family protein [Paenibacillus curdlanolyticus]EFM10411.1 stress protein [Paenibacillus curdlanolyticus YK9]